MSRRDAITTVERGAAVRAFRAWRLVRSRDGLRLASVDTGVLWQPDEPFTAVCWNGPGEGEELRRRMIVDSAQALAGGLFRSPSAGLALDHDPPGETCECGVYGVRDPGNLRPYVDRDFYADSPGYHDRLDERVRALGLEPLGKVIGRVSLWSRVTLTDTVDAYGDCTGYRAQHAAIEQLYELSELPSDLFTELAATYRVSIGHAGLNMTVTRQRSRPASAHQDLLRAVFFG